MKKDNEAEVPDGAAVFPLIPPELGVHPLLLAALHATVFLVGSEDSIVDPEAATEASEAIAQYFQRLSGDELKRVREDMDCLVRYAQTEKWPKAQIEFLTEVFPK